MFPILPPTGYTFLNLFILLECLVIWLISMPVIIVFKSQNKYHAKYTDIAKSQSVSNCYTVVSKQEIFRVSIDPKIVVNSYVSDLWVMFLCKICELGSAITLNAKKNSHRLLMEKIFPG